jgi:hypothetical protein
LTYRETILLKNKSRLCPTEKENSEAEIATYSDLLRHFKQEVRILQIFSSGFQITQLLFLFQKTIMNLIDYLNLYWSSCQNMEDSSQVLKLLRSPIDGLHVTVNRLVS